MTEPSNIGRLTRVRRVIFKRKANVNHCGKKNTTNEVNSNRILLRVSYIFIKGNVISKKKKQTKKKNKRKISIL